MDSQPRASRRLSVALDNTSNTSPSTLHTSIQQERPTSEPAVKTRELENQNEASVPSDGVLDIGWDEDTPHLTNPAVEGLANERLWLLVRRFNKEIYHIKAMPDSTHTTLDFDTVEDEEFSPNKLRAQFERLYMGLVLGFLAGIQHFLRLRSWREPRRTSAFCLAYFTAWALDCLVLLLLTTLVALVLFPEVRQLMFPPVPLSIADYQSGKLTQPPAGVLASADSATGAPENVKGEAVENEASNFVTSIASIAVNILTDKDPQHHEGQTGSTQSQDWPGPDDIAIKIAGAKDKASGSTNPSQDKTKAPIQKIMVSKMQPLLYLVTAISDVWERLANLLNPTAPFPQYTHRMRIVALAVSLLLTSFSVSFYWVYKMTTFAAGFMVFAEPMLEHIYSVIPLQDISLYSTIFDGVPTNAQLTVALLRLGEIQNAPLPPPPQLKHSPPKGSIGLEKSVIDATGGDMPLGVEAEEVLRTAAPDEDKMRHTGGGDDLVTSADSQGKGRRLFKWFRSGARGVARTAVATDKVRAKMGTESATKRLGAVSVPPKLAIAGPVEFNARYNGEEGFVYLTTNTLSADICFSKERATSHKIGENGGATLRPLWALPVAEIRELNKYSGYGAKSKLMAGWVLEKQVMDGIEITDVQGNTTILTAMPRRDQLFNRLCTIGNQRWAVW